MISAGPHSSQIRHYYAQHSDENIFVHLQNNCSERVQALENVFY